MFIYLCFVQQLVNIQSDKNVRIMIGWQVLICVKPWLLVVSPAFEYSWCEFLCEWECMWTRYRMIMWTRLHDETNSHQLWRHTRIIQLLISARYLQNHIPLWMCLKYYIVKHHRGLFYTHLIWSWTWKLLYMFVANDLFTVLKILQLKSAQSELLNKSNSVIFNKDVSLQLSEQQTKKQLCVTTLTLQLNLSPSNSDIHRHELAQPYYVAWFLLCCLKIINMYGRILYRVWFLSSHGCTKASYIILCTRH